jgi:hypothetical protein
MQSYQVYKIIIVKRQFSLSNNETYLSISLYIRGKSIVFGILAGNGYYSFGLITLLAFGSGHKIILMS